MSGKVLVIESDLWLGGHYQSTLERDGFHVERVSNAYSAMDAIDSRLPDTVIMNFNLSGASSIALLHELQTYVDTGNVPVIICGNTAELSLDELEPYGVKRLVNSLTMRPSDLVAAVRSVLV